MAELLGKVLPDREGDPAVTTRKHPPADPDRQRG